MVSLEQELREFAWWKNRRDELIRRALAAGMPVERLAAAMDVSESAIRRVRARIEP